MNNKAKRLEVLKQIISSQEVCSQEDVLKSLALEGFVLTQATLSRDLKQLKVAKAATAKGKYVYVLPNDALYKREEKLTISVEQFKSLGFLSINFSGNMAVIKTKPGYASSIAYNLDSSDVPEILGTIAGDDTIFIVMKENVSQNQLVRGIATILEGMNV